VSVTGAEAVLGAHDIAVKADKLFADVDFADAEMLILPGGATKLHECKPLCDLLLAHNNEDKLIAAICAAPSVLGRLGILQGKQATCYPGFEEYLGESYIDGLVVESKNIVTAKGPGLSSDFAFCLIEKLAGTEVADQVYDAAQY
jgi:4-methyl-5(b-hydroxyethyl)-thiazole monophosphate biosynthesis